MAPALTAAGQIDAAYALLLQQDCPSWLYALKHDATTVWERWDSMLPDGTVNPGGMTSFNHYALGAVARWLHTEVAGLTAAAPGYREVVFQPRPGDGLTWATATHDSPYGRLAIQWELDPSGNLSVRTTVPTGVNARIEWPAFTTAGTAIGCVWRRPSPQLLPRSPRRSGPARVAAHDTVVVIGARVVQEGGPAPKPFAPRPCGTGARSAINRDVR